MKFPVVLFFLSTLLTAAINPAYAEKASDTGPAESRSEVTESLDPIQKRREEAVVQLREIQASLKDKAGERRDLQHKLKSADKSTKDKLEAELKELNSEIELLNKTFEQIVIGGVDLSVFGVKEEAFNWRDELVTVVKPLIENVKRLTEKPRKIESLRQVVSDKELARKATEEALKSIEHFKQEANFDSVSQKLVNIEIEWQSRLEDLDREIQLAEFQLASLEGKDVPWVEIFKRGIYNFLTGRGLTLLFVLIAAIAVWGFMRGILWLVRKRTSESHDRSGKVHYRLASYGYRMLTGILVAIAMMMVLYFRQDLLLLAIMVVIFFGAALALKNLLPIYIAEGRLLLNIGSVRERERVIYNGVPWEVSSINVHTRLVNPKIRGRIRLPIRQMHEMISRPTAGEAWFPSSEDDWILLDGDNLNQVISQSVDVVELKDLNSVSRFMPTADYYAAGYPNLSRSKEFRIALRFGIDYATQTEDVGTIETAFSEGIKRSFKGMPYEKHVLEISADFDSAGDSSLNYLILTKFDSDAAQFYNRIKRRIQRACVKVCSENDWGIPFPQLSVHMATDNPKSAD